MVEIMDSLIKRTDSIPEHMQVSDWLIPLMCAFTAASAVTVQELFAKPAQDKAFFSHFGPYHYVVFLVSLAVFLCIFHCLKNCSGSLFEKHMQKRYIIALLFVVFAFAFSFNNSSIHYFQNIFGVENTQLFGRFRPIRCDEYAVWTPLALSQEKVQFAAYNTLIREGKMSTYWVSVGGIPAWNLAVVFKPFYWGFLLFGSEKGLSILWSLRVCCLMLVSYSFGIEYFNKSWIASLYSILLLFGGYTQWWFSQSICEVLIFGQLIVICAFNSFEQDERGQQIFYSVLLAWAFGCYVMIAYPSWLFGIGWITIAMIFGRASDAGWDIKGKMFLFVPLAFSFAYLLLIAYLDKDTLLSVANSAYPGERVITGGTGIPKSLFAGAAQILYPYLEDLGISTTMNVCNASSYLTLAPFGSVFAIYSVFSRKRADIQVVAICVTELIFYIFCIFGFPEWLAKVTFFSQISRPVLPISICDTLLLCIALRDIEQFSKKEKIRVFLISAVPVTAGLYYSLKNIFIFSDKAFIIIFVFFLAVTTVLLAFGVFSSNLKSRRTFVCLTVLVLFISGGLVNPLTLGTDAITELELVKKIQTTGNPDDLWMFEGDFTTENIVLVAGKKSFLSTQEYGNTEYWKLIDPEGKNEVVYNRFANFDSNIIPDCRQTTMENNYPDRIVLSINVNDLIKYNVKYVISRDSELMLLDNRFKLIDHADSCYIYKLDI